MTAELFVTEPRASEHDLVWENRTSLMNQVQDEAGRVDARDRARNSNVSLRHQALGEAGEPSRALGEAVFCCLSCWFVAMSY